MHLRPWCLNTMGVCGHCLSVIWSDIPHNKETKLLCHSLAAEPKPKSEVWNVAKLEEVVCLQKPVHVSLVGIVNPLQTPTPRWPRHPQQTAESRGKASRNRWVDHITSQRLPTGRLCSLWMTARAYFKSLPLRADMVFLCAGFSARTYSHITKSNTWPSLTLVPRNNSVLSCRGAIRELKGEAKALVLGAMWASYTTQR